MKVEVSLIPTLNEAVADALSGGVESLLGMEFERGEVRGVVRVISDVGCDF